MRELKELLCEGERIYELTRCASSSVYFIGPETDDINHMDVSGALEDTLHRMLDAEFTEEEIAEHLCAYQDSDAMDDDDCYYIDLDYVIYDFYPMSILDTGIHYEEPRHTYTVHFFDTVICKNLVIKDDSTDGEILEAMQEKLGINPEGALFWAAQLVRISLPSVTSLCVPGIRRMRSRWPGRQHRHSLLPCLAKSSHRLRWRCYFLSRFF